ELEHFLSTDPEYVKDVLSWWYEHRHIVFESTNTHISATSVNVEHVFSMGCILLSHLHSHL
ncbi:hypothetical protein L208DRAFT_1221004, partial [Tricholoma matsutake]